MPRPARTIPARGRKQGQARQPRRRTYSWSYLEWRSRTAPPQSGRVLPAQPPLWPSPSIFSKDHATMRFVKECTPLDFELMPTLLRNPFLTSNGLDSLRRKKTWGSVGLSFLRTRLIGEVEECGSTCWFLEETRECCSFFWSACWCVDETADL